MPPVACYGMLGNCRPVGGGVLTKDEVKRIMESLIGSTPSFTGCTVTAEFHRRPLPQLYVEALAPASDPRLLTIMVDQGTYRIIQEHERLFMFSRQGLGRCRFAQNACINLEH